MGEDGCDVKDEIRANYSLDGPIGFPCMPWTEHMDVLYQYSKLDKEDQAVKEDHNAIVQLSPYQELTLPQRL